MAMKATLHNDYGELRQLIKRQGLLERQLDYYAVVVARTAVMLALSLLILVRFHNPWVLVLDAVFLAFISAQIGFIGHEAAHRSIFDSPRNNDILGLIAFNLLLGGSLAKWKDKHNAHHSNPNQIDHDPDIDILVVAFSEEQAAQKRGIPRVIVKFQAYLIVPLLTLEMISLRLASMRFLIVRRPKGAVVEALLIVSHFILYFGLLFTLLGLWPALLFFAVHHAVLGVHVGAVFAPNHKGMPVLESDSDIDFLRRQVITSRNLKAGVLTDFLTGGLACQVEHHLFPTMPRNNLRIAGSSVREFCADRSIPFYETSVLQSFREILEHLHEVSASIRTARA